MLTDKQLLHRLATLCRVGRRIDVSVCLLLIDVEDRRLDLESSYSSMHEFCRRELGMSEGTTHRRVESARLVRRIPALVDHLKAGTATLSTLAMLRNHLTEENYADLLARAQGRSRAQIAELIAEIDPRPDVPARLRKLPTRTPTPAASTTPPSYVEGAATTPATDVTPPSFPKGKPGRLEPLAPSRWKLQLTASQELHDKLERLQSLMRHQNPSGDLATIIEKAVDLLLEKMEKPRRAPTEGPATAKTTTRSIKHGEIAAETRRAVYARDGHQCTFRNADGRRCESKDLLEIDHIEPRAAGGSGELENLRVLCHAHNRLQAEKHFGREHIERRIQEGRAERADAQVPPGEPAKAAG